MTGGGIVALVPIRSLADGKTRLRGALSPEAREALTRRMLRGVVRAAIDSDAVSAVVVVSPDASALALAAAEGTSIVPLLQEAAFPGLNAALEQGRTWALRHCAAALLILFGDLPLLSPDDVRNIVRRPAPVVLAPDRHGTGTNAMLLRLGATDHCGDRFRFGFGPGSYARHADEAHRLGLDVATSLAPGTAFDLDTAEDLRLLVGGERGKGGGGEDGVPSWSSHDGSIGRRALS